MVKCGEILSIKYYFYISVPYLWKTNCSMVQQVYYCAFPLFFINMSVSCNTATSGHNIYRIYRKLWIWPMADRSIPPLTSSTRIIPNVHRLIIRRDIRCCWRLWSGRPGPVSDVLPQCCFPELFFGVAWYYFRLQRSRLYAFCLAALLVYSLIRQAIFYRTCPVLWHVCFTPRSVSGYSSWITRNWCCFALRVHFACLSVHRLYPSFLVKRSARFRDHTSCTGHRRKDKISGTFSGTGCPGRFRTCQLWPVPCSLRQVLLSPSLPVRYLLYCRHLNIPVVDSFLGLHPRPYTDSVFINEAYTLFRLKR